MDESYIYNVKQKKSGAKKVCQFRFSRRKMSNGIEVPRDVICKIKGREWK